MITTTDTKDKLLNAAQRMIQTQGYNAFSYADLEKIVKIRKASIHHHFPTKMDLGIAVTRLYRNQFMARLTDIDAKRITWLEKIREYAKLYKDVLSNNRLCLCAALASDISTLPKKLQNEVRGFMNDNIAWLSSQLPTNHADMAKLILSSLQGGMILANSMGKKTMYSSIIHTLIEQLEKLK